MTAETASSVEAPAMAAETASSAEAPAMAAASSAEPEAAPVEAPAMTAAAAPRLAATGLSTDTLAAAGGNAADGFGYVGVWAVNAEACATVDQAGGSGYVVITSATFRDGPSAAYGNFGALKDGKLTLKAGQRSIDIAQTTPDELTIAGTAYVRCTP